MSQKTEPKTEDKTTETVKEALKDQETRLERQEDSRKTK